MLQLAQLLPTEENFLLCFREFVGSSSEFMAVSVCISSAGLMVGPHSSAADQRKSLKLALPI